MIYTTRLYPYGKYLLLSGRIIWGVTPLYTVPTTSAYNPAKMEEIYNDASWTYVSARTIPISKASQSVRINSATYETEMCIMGSVGFYYNDVAGVPNGNYAYAMMGYFQEILEGKLFKPLLHFSGLNNTGSTISGSTAAYIPGGVIFSL